MDDLQQLLDQLDSANQSKVQKSDTESGDAWVDGTIDPSELMGDIEGIHNDESNAITESSFAVNQEIKPSTAPEQQTPFSVDFNKYFDRLDGVTDEILGACRSDRQEVQDTIQLCRGQIDDAIQKGREPARMFVDGLVKAIEVKANVNMTAVKMMEANSKMLAAIKASGGIQVNNQNLSVVNNHDLEQILDQPMTDEDEF